MLLAAFTATNVLSRKTDTTAYEKKSYPLPSFKAISASAGIDVIFSPGQGRQKVEAEADRKLLPYLSLTVKNGTLVIGMKKTKSLMSKSIIVRVSGNRDIDELQASSGAEIEVTGPLKSNGELRLSASGGGEIHLKKGVTCTTLQTGVSGGGEMEVEKITCKTLRADASGGGETELKGISADNIRAQASGGGDITLSGTCRRSADLMASGGGEIDAEELKAAHTTAKASGGGEISCYARYSLTANAASGGTVSYRGNPTQVKRESKQGIRHKK